MCGIARIAISAGEHEIRPYIAMMAMDFAVNPSSCHLVTHQFPQLPQYAPVS
jgi:hypothetical protein